MASALRSSFPPLLGLTAFPSLWLAGYVWPPLNRRVHPAALQQLDDRRRRRGQDRALPG